MKRSGEKGIKDFFKPKRILIDCEEEESVASSSSQKDSDRNRHILERNWRKTTSVVDL